MKCITNVCGLAYWMLHLYSTLLVPVRGRGVISTLSIYTAINVLMRGTEISLYSTLLIPVRGRRVCSLAHGETLLKLGSKLRSDALPATTIDFIVIRTHNSPHTSADRVF